MTVFRFLFLLRFSRYSSNCPISLSANSIQTYLFLFPFTLYLLIPFYLIHSTFIHKAAMHKYMFNLFNKFEYLCIFSKQTKNLPRHMSVYRKICKWPFVRKSLYMKLFNYIVNVFFFHLHFSSLFFAFLVIFKYSNYVIFIYRVSTTCCFLVSPHSFDLHTTISLQPLKIDLIYFNFASFFYFISLQNIKKRQDISWQCVRESDHVFDIITWLQEIPNNI